MTAPVILSRSQIEDQRWNEVISRSPQRVFYGYSWYLDVVCDNWQALVWPSAAYYQIVMPLPVLRKWGMTIVLQPFYCQFLGLFSVNEIQPEQIKGFMDQLFSHFSYVSAYSFSPHNHLQLCDVLSGYSHLEMSVRHTHLLSLQPSYSEIQNSYSQDRKINLKRSAGKAWSCEISDDIEPMISLFRENHARNIPGGVHERSYELLRKLFNVLKEKRLAELNYAIYEGQRLAGTLVVKEGPVAVYLFNAADTTGHQGNGRTFLLDRYFSVNAGQPVVFDFESPEVASIASFYKSFGSTPTPYFAIRRNYLPFPLRQIQDWRRRFLLKTK